MTVKILELTGTRWAILPERDYRRLAARAGDAEGNGPELPMPDAHWRTDDSTVRFAPPGSPSR